MEFITLWAFSQSWALTNLPNLYWVNVEVVAKHSVSSLFFSYLPLWFGWAILGLEKTQETPKHLISTYRTQKGISTYKIFSQEKYCGIKVYHYSYILIRQRVKKQPLPSLFSTSMSCVLLFQ